MDAIIYSVKEFNIEGKMIFFHGDDLSIFVKNIWL